MAKSKSGLGEGAFKKALNTKTHRERSQPKGRRKLGHLEKHKDYVKRARNFHFKEDTLKSLRVRAVNRNEDEFYFGMIKSRVRDGRHIKDFTTVNSSSQPTSEMLNLMKGQDIRYITLQRNINQKKIDRLKEEIVTLEKGVLGDNDDTAKISANKHIIFVDDEEELGDVYLRRFKEETVEVPAQMDQLEELIGGNLGAKITAANFSLPELILSQDLSQEVIFKEENGVMKEENDDKVKKLNRKRAELMVREERVKQLEGIESKLRTDRTLLGKGRRSKIEGRTDAYGFPCYKWEVERSK